MRAGNPPEAICGLGAVIDRFDCVVLDQWGVLHAGGPVFPAARDCIRRLRAAGRTVAVLSNSGRRSAGAARQLAARGLPETDYDLILTAGEAAWHGLARRAGPPFDGLGRRCFPIHRGGSGLVDGLDLETVRDAAGADFILLAGLDDGRTDRGQWRAMLARAAERRVPLLCVNPDTTMFGATGLLPGPGAVAAFYEGLGGPVHYVGKPHRPIYEQCLARLGRPAPERVLAVGDSLDHDILGGERAGLPTALVAGGIHAPALSTAVAPEALADAVHALAREAGAMPRWVLPALAW